MPSRAAASSPVRGTATGFATRGVGAGAGLTRARRVRSAASIARSSARAARSSIRRSRSSATSRARVTRRRSRAAGSSRSAASIASGSRVRGSSSTTLQPGPASPRRTAAITSSRFMWARLPSAGPSEGARRTSRSRSQPGSTRKADDERPPSRMRRSGRARCPSRAKRAPSSAPVSRATSSWSRSSSRRATSRASGPSAGVARAASSAARRPVGAGGLAGGEHAPPAGPGVVGVGPLEGDRGGGRVVQREQRGRETGRRALRVADRRRRGEQRHLAPAALGAACRGGARGGDERIDHGTNGSGRPSEGPDYARTVNRLANESSLYLRQHAENPVDWYPWGPEALERAAAEDRPVLLSIGYSSCHWCHVMAHESFEDPEVAAVMNELFVNVKVDREERPDVDALYMQATLSLAGQGGWPMTVFLTPDGRPFYAGTYFPKDARGGLPAFPDLCRAIAGAYRNRREDVEGQAAEVARRLAMASRAPPLHRRPRHPGAGRRRRGPGPHLRPGRGRVRRRPQVPALAGPRVPAAPAVAAARRHQRARDGGADAQRDGRRRHPRPGRRGLPPVQRRRPLAGAALREDALRQRPAGARLRARPPAHRRARTPAGGRDDARLPAARDARRGRRVRRRPRTPTRPAARARSSCGPPPSWSGCCPPSRRARSRSGTASPRRATSRAPRSSRWSPRSTPCHGSWARTPSRCIAAALPALYAARAERPAPARDDKVVAAWNGLAIAALAEAGVVLGRDDYVAAAAETAEFVLGAMVVEGRLRRVHSPAGPAHLGQLDDHADLCHGLLCLYAATFDPRWLREARALAARMVALFGDPGRGRLLLLGLGRRGAGRAHPGGRGPPDPGRQLPGRPRAAAPGRPDRRRDARGPRRGRRADGARRPRPVPPGVRDRADRAGPPPRHPARDRDRRRARTIRAPRR